ncbi:hypothetical protein CYLTODRAFT_88322 [Cylindrobasidium torrendii FP15055 ss-10]|uniref:Uncharacterized protein n=1 Tax=Cylindrobasidium torrendii FP15055 ss-10 TaxID=1314674 RepID=A0A0D7B217_9AGAR|nr:hypothetical protein CYLTODRAFT_88322 [Cylindrobasidium torrendii FP15055 ss-10]
MAETIPQGDWENWYTTGQEPNSWYKRMQTSEYPLLGFIPRDFVAPAKDGDLDLLHFDLENLPPRKDLSDTDTSNLAVSTKFKAFLEVKDEFDVVETAIPYRRADFAGGGFMSAGHEHELKVTASEGRFIDKMRGHGPGTFTPCIRKHAKTQNFYAKGTMNGWIAVAILSPNNLEPIPALSAAIEHNLDNGTEPKDRVDLRRVVPACYGKLGYWAAAFPLTTAIRNGNELVMYNPETRGSLYNAGPGYPAT